MLPKIRIPPPLNEKCRVIYLFTPSDKTKYKS